ncbi:MAG: zinc ribbon domain-containing protein, partial [Leptospiraceae bacterium]|nr:zinc ribbon domain-containing protein [Leptospiraceae bacterium]
GAPIARVKFFPKTTYFNEMKNKVFLAALIHAGYNFILFYFKMPLLGLFTSLVIAYFLIQYIDKELKYLLTQTPFLPAGTCSNCGTENNLKAKQCKKCGTNLVQEYFLVCSNCGTKLPLDYTTCSVCGLELKHEKFFQDKEKW